ncbi:MAG: serine/threonine protein kinase [Deltaproteobacteria bacterium]|nr:serine/threonine protein kinase [Deltaproteobacteria bacterium]
MGDRIDDDRPTVDLGPRAFEEAEEAIESDVDDSDVHPTHSHHGGANGSDTKVQTDIPGALQFGYPDRPVDPVHGLPTQQLALDNKKRGQTSLTKLSESRTTSSPVEAMRLDEIGRTRVFLRVALLLSIGGAIAALLTGGDVIAQRVVIPGSLLGAGGAFWILRSIKDTTKYDQGKLAIPGFALVIGSMTGVYYWGVASPVAAMLVYGIYFFSLGSNRTITLVMYLLVAVLHGALGIAIVAGWIVDRGLVNMSSLATMDQLSVIAIIELLYAIAFITARISQKTTLDVMSQLEKAVRGMVQRDALLAEARAELDRALKIGGPGRFTEQVVGAFRLGVLIGRGGMGEVYEAHGVTDQREAAVKLLHPGTLADPTSVQRFMREAQITAKLETPYIVRVLEVGTTAGDVPYLAMERLRGNDLAHTLRRQRKLQLPAVRSIVEQVALGLEAARVAGIVHRDLKPHNIFQAEADGSRRWKILDFGVSKSGTHGTLTQGHVVGTPAYMAPEQARGEDVDHRADVYSLAAIIYRSVTGHPAFTGKDVPTTLYDVVYRIPTQPSILSQLPADVDRVLAIGLAKNPLDRFQTALELAEWFGLAVESRLTPEMRQRADDLISVQPWGTRPGVSTTAP